MQATTIITTWSTIMVTPLSSFLSSSSLRIVSYSCVTGEAHRLEAQLSCFNLFQVWLRRDTDLDPEPAVFNSQHGWFICCCAGCVLKTLLVTPLRVLRSSLSLWIPSYRCWAFVACVQATPVLFLHMGASSAIIWKEFLAYNVNTYNIYTF